MLLIDGMHDNAYNAWNFSFNACLFLGFLVVWSWFFLWMNRLLCCLVSNFTWFYFLTQDYKVHQEEILTKLVQIMRERVLYHLRKLPPVVESWNRPIDTDSQPSLIAKEIVKVTNCKLECSKFQIH